MVHSKMRAVGTERAMTGPFWSPSKAEGAPIAGRARSLLFQYASPGAGQLVGFAALAITDPPVAAAGGFGAALQPAAVSIVIAVVEVEWQAAPKVTRAAMPAVAAVMAAAVDMGTVYAGTVYAGTIDAGTVYARTVDVGAET